MIETHKTEDPSEIPAFSLVGGPLFRLCVSIGLIPNGTSTVAFGLALGAFLWIVLLAMAAIDGSIPHLFSMSFIGGHVRLLVVIPLFFACEGWVGPMMTDFVSGLVLKKIVTESELPTLSAEIARVVQWKNSWFMEVLCLGAAILMSFGARSIHLVGETAVNDPFRSGADPTMAALWYWVVCLTLFRFLLFLWLWRLCHWAYFLWRITRLNLRLMPTHPDGAAGIGSLEIVHTCFTPLVLAVSAVESASFAEEISVGAMTFEAIYPQILLTLCFDALVFVGPLYLFSPGLWNCRVRGLRDYMSLASRYVDSFDDKWIRAADSGESLLGTPDLQSLADLSNSVNVVRNMRLAPISGNLWTQILIAAVLPLLPLLLFKYPIAELTEKFITRLSGM